MRPARTPPRLVTRALIASFLTVALVVSAVFTLVSLDVRQRMRETVAANLAAGQQVFARVETRIDQERLATVATLAENPTLKAALDTWETERRAGGDVDELVATVRLELQKIAPRVNADALAIADPAGGIVVSTGPQADAWTPGTRLRQPGATAAEDAVVTRGERVFRVRGVPLVVRGAAIGTLELGTALDVAFARELAALARAESAVVIHGKVHATTLPAALAQELTDPALAAASSNTVQLAGQSWAIRRVGGVGPVSYYALASIDAAAAEMTWSALRGLTWIAVVALALAALGSWWLASAITKPIDTLSASLAQMTVARQFDTPVPPPGSSRELDALAGTFNALIRSLAEAEAETQAAYFGAIRALAAALDARDPYTAGHSERVSALSVEIGLVLRLPDHEMSILRLGALLHDIGKIGVPDEVLRKPGALTASEFELIRAHPVIGARILRTIPFLAAHLPIVELHHERPDGRGYPYGLTTDAIPLAARIVHVADAFDAITSARAYRPGRLPHEAITELRRGVGTDFDAQAVDALQTALPRLPAAFAAFDSSAFQAAAFQRTQAS